MRKWLKLSGVILGCVLMGGCDMIHILKETTQEVAEFKEAEVHSEEEMKTFTLQCLKEKYNNEFELEDDLIYAHEHGEEDRPLYLSGHAHVVGKDDLRCYFEVTEPNIFEDNYASNYYKEDIDAYLRKKNGPMSSEYDIEALNNISNKVFDPNMDFKEFLYKYPCDVFYTAYVPATSDVHEYIPIIREWMDVVYAADYDWYFELHDLNNKELCYFTLDPVDNGFDSTDDWDDETIYEYILSNMRSW